MADSKRKAPTEVAYCSTEHQRSDWSRHKLACKAAPYKGTKRPRELAERGAPVMSLLTQPTTEAELHRSLIPFPKDLPRETKYERLIDAFRLHQDDQFYWNQKREGLYKTPQEDPYPLVRCGSSRAWRAPPTDEATRAVCQVCEAGATAPADLVV